jgi:hypothetical protein
MTSLTDLVENGLPPLDKSNADFLSSPHIETVHKAASINSTGANIPWPEHLPSPPVAEMERDDPERLSVLLYDIRRKGRHASYSSEADVQRLVQQALDDALSLMGLAQSCDSKLEYTLFSYRPDIVIVFHKFMGIILIVEVKKPEKDFQINVSCRRQRKAKSIATKKLRETPGVFDGELVAGQVFDYLKGVINMGNATPFAVLTTYDRAVLAWIDSPTGNSAELLRKKLSSLGQTETVLPNSCPPKTATPVRGVQEKVTTKTSPDPAERQIFLGLSVVQEEEGSTIPDDEEDQSDTEMEDSDIPRIVNYSPVYKEKNIVPLLVLAIRCGIESSKARTRRQLPSHGDSIGGECGMVHPDGLVWKRLPDSTTWNFQKVPKLPTMFLWKDLGRGASGRAFLACDKKGNACVLKFFLFDDREVRRLEDEEERLAKEKYLLARTKEKADLELERWKQVYPRYKDHVFVKKLNKLYALQMPYFNTIPTDQRSSMLEKVRKVLQRFSDLGFRYRDGDLRWRHVGCDADNNCILFDLESLDPLEDEESGADDDDGDKMDDVEAQLLILENKI